MLPNRLPVGAIAARGLAQVGGRLWHLPAGRQVYRHVVHSPLLF